MTEQPIYGRRKMCGNKYRIYYKKNSIFSAPTLRLHYQKRRIETPLTGRCYVEKFVCPGSYMDYWEIE
jgi:hypothetical protein